VGSKGGDAGGGEEVEGGSAGVGGNAAGISDGKVEGTGAAAERDNGR